MTELDWIVVLFALALAWLGYRQGFIVGVLSFAGFAAGAFIGTRLGPSLLPHGASSPYAPAFGLLGALLAGAILASGLEGVGRHLRRVLPLPGLRLIDGGMGALLSVVIALGVVWIIAAVLAQVPGQSTLRSDIQRSLILRTLNSVLPPSGPILNALARLDPLPSLAGPAPNVAPPSPAIAQAGGVKAASASVVRVLGTACGLAIEGSGWVAALGEVVTNAHVVAGESDTTVEVEGQAPNLVAVPVAFDPTDDVAVLHVPDLREPPLSLASQPQEGASGAILGYPENGPFDVQAGRIGHTQQVISQNAYGEGPVLRLLTPLRGLVRPGNSGGPVVGADGKVLATVFASTTDSSTPGGYGVANATVAKVLRDARGPVGTGRCTSA
ncbi:MAG TPA: MarP family serine protease [Solirubrobacteraceae bacterium]|nr:MarP family serine protease [Solirubrobacteraceae bacterium]